ncbi:hypothetical protein K1719_001330 [Acacia pycnantha]|nr:hypothetical protein K1719_001330 [Acacia pycnantha]
MSVNLEPLDLGVPIPYHFRCPISLDLMREPVTISTGQTYDRTSVQSWFAAGNTTCPVTRAPLSDFTHPKPHSPPPYPGLVRFQSSFRSRTDPKSDPTRPPFSGSDAIESSFFGDLHSSVTYLCTATPPTTR